jgi:hypothetical protein
MSTMVGDPQSLQVKAIRGGGSMPKNRLLAPIGAAVVGALAFGLSQAPNGSAGLNSMNATTSLSMANHAKAAAATPVQPPPGPDRARADRRIHERFREERVRERYREDRRFRGHRPYRERFREDRRLRERFREDRPFRERERFREDRPFRERERFGEDRPFRERFGEERPFRDRFRGDRFRDRFADEG